MIRKDYKPKPLKPTQQAEPPKRWHIVAIACLVVILVTDWEATAAMWGL